MDDLGEIDAREISTIPIGEGIVVRVGRYGPYIEETIPAGVDSTTGEMAEGATAQIRRVTINLVRTPRPGATSWPRPVGTAPMSPRCCQRRLPH